MAYQGHCRLRAVHVDGLIKRFRQLAGHIGYLERHPMEGHGPLADLRAARDALVEALKLCAGDLDPSSLRPITYRPPSPLPGTAMTRAVLAQLRIAAGWVTAGQLIADLVDKHELRFHTDAERNRFERQVRACVASLAKRRIIQQSADGHWSV